MSTLIAVSFRFATPFVLQFSRKAPLATNPLHNHLLCSTLFPNREFLVPGKSLRDTNYQLYLATKYKHTQTHSHKYCFSSGGDGRGSVNLKRISPREYVYVCECEYMCAWVYVCLCEYISTNVVVVVVVVANNDYSRKTARGRSRNEFFHTIILCIKLHIVIYNIITDEEVKRGHLLWCCTIYLVGTGRERENNNSSSIIII